tara:strand:- start:140 stop:421 length:282 start_codon:yes stop_codon:yes gene_type:complete
MIVLLFGSNTGVFSTCGAAPSATSQRRCSPDIFDKKITQKIMNDRKRLEIAIRRLKRIMHTHTKPTPPGGFNVERVFLQDCIERLCSELEKMK